MVAENFKDLFKLSDPANFYYLFDGFTPKVTQAMNDSLIRKVSDEEVKEAVFSIKPASAPVADGMTGLFFQNYWKMVGNQVIKEVKNFFHNGVFPKEWNYTQLCLLPKVIQQREMTDMRPISLCSVMYEIISKIMVSRLQPLLHQIVSTTQSAFVAERQISNNVLVAHEMVHALRIHPTISYEFKAIKSDMSKAYDRVELRYIHDLLIALGFHQTWIDWVMTCVSSVTYSVLINDKPFGLIIPEEGLRQGDPFSPFFFVMCTEGFTHFINKAEVEGFIDGIQFSSSGPMVHHLLFTDDSLFICKSSVSQAETLQKILKEYGDATGERININKSSITFGAKVDEGLKESIKMLTGILNEG